MGVCVCVGVYTCMCVLELVEKSKVSNLDDRVRRNLFLYLFLVYCYISFPNAISNFHSHSQGNFLLYFSSNSMQQPPSSASDEENINLLVPLSILRMTRNLKVPTQDSMDGVKQLQISDFCNTRHLYHLLDAMWPWIVLMQIVFLSGPSSAHALFECLKGFTIIMVVSFGRNSMQITLVESPKYCEHGFSEESPYPAKKSV